MAMAEVCADCTEHVPCAQQMLHGGLEGGFAAGVWMPWKADSADTKTIRGMRRIQLQVIAGERKARR